MKHRGLKYAACLLALVSLACVLGCTPRKPAGNGPSGAAQGSASAPVAEVVFVQGGVTINGAAVDIGSKVKSPILVKTGPLSACELVWNKKNILHFKSDTTAQIDLGSATARLRVDGGEVGAVLKGLAQVLNGDSFRVETKEVVLGIRGTFFFVHVGPEKTYLCDCSGYVEMTPAGGSPIEVVSSHHKAMEFWKENGSTRSAPAGLEYHTDADMEALAAKVGVTVDWNGAPQ